MITLDKVKLVAALDCLLDFDPAQFSVVKEGGRIKTMRFRMVEPFTFSVEVNQDAKEFVVEFTGKILGKDYPQLISKETIMMCFDRLNEFGVCKVDPAKMMTAEVVKCDVTKDVSVEDIPTMTRYIKGRYGITKPSPAPNSEMGTSWSRKACQPTRGGSE